MSSDPPAPQTAHVVRTVSRSLSGYLCGTHSGVLSRRRGDRLPPAGLARAHERLARAPAAGGPEVDERSLGAARWQPPAGADELRRALHGALDVPAVVDLILYGSQARHSTTGYSDVDAILVVTDRAAERPGALAELRSRVLRAQRHVLEYQPMQHHAFEVATPTLLHAAESALELPANAVAETASLFGRSVGARFAPTDPHEARDRFERMADQLERVAAWPRHPWVLHRLLSMFELLPALFLQAKAQRVEKWRSFAVAREWFPAAWRPYETLREVRERWPRSRHRMLRGMLRASSNPWAGVDMWRRAPIRAPAEVRSLLAPSTLGELHALVGMMRREADR